MSPIWLKGGDIRMAASGVPELVRAWIYRKQLSDCPPLPAAITIIGCEPPLCVEFTNTNLSPYGRVYVRQSCGAWSGSGGYAWPADVPDCPYPDGITIEETECDGVLVQLQVTGDVELANAWYAEDWGPPGNFCGCMSFTQPPNQTVWPYCKNFSDLGSMSPFADGTPKILERSGSGWHWEVPGWWVPRGLNINCNGDVSWCGHIAYSNLAGDYFSFDGINCIGGTSIPLDADDLPIGSSTIEMVGWLNGKCGCEDTCDGSIGTLTITVSKV